MEAKLKEALGKAMQELEDAQIEFAECDAAYNTANVDRDRSIKRLDQAQTSLDSQLLLLKKNAPFQTKWYPSKSQSVPA